jgi:hypothetical protein
MNTKKVTAFKTIPDGTNVTWHDSSAICHGTVTGVHTFGTTAHNTTYLIEEHDHHSGESYIVHQLGKALTCSSDQCSAMKTPVVVKVIAL